MKYLKLLLILLIATAAKAQNFGGIGAQLMLDTAGGYSMPRIAALVQGSPADTTLHATNYIYKVNDVSCRNKTIEEVVGMIRGEVGTQVRITETITKDGKRPKVYTLTRVGIQGAQPAQAPDPQTAFTDWADRQVAELAKTHTIIKKYNNACGENRYYNFEAAPKKYHVLVMTVEAHTAGVNFTTAAKVFDNDDEANATPLTTTGHVSEGQMAIAKTEGDVTFKKDCIGVVNVKTTGDLTRCFWTYVVIYK